MTFETRAELIHGLVDRLNEITAASGEFTAADAADKLWAEITPDEIEALAFSMRTQFVRMHLAHSRRFYDEPPSEKQSNHSAKWEAIRASAADGRLRAAINLGNSYKRLGDLSLDEVTIAKGLYAERERNLRHSRQIFERLEKAMTASGAKTVKDLPAEVVDKCLK